MGFWNAGSSASTTVWVTMQAGKGNGKTVVIALGGNALGNTPQEQLELVQNTAKHIVDMIEEGTNVVVSHGNGPQVGMINNAFAYVHEVLHGVELDDAPGDGAGHHLAPAAGRVLLHGDAHWSSCRTPPSTSST